MKSTPTIFEQLNSLPEGGKTDTQPAAGNGLLIAAAVLGAVAGAFVFHSVWYENHHEDEPGFDLDFTQLFDGVIAIALLVTALIVLAVRWGRNGLAPPWWLAITHGWPIVWAASAGAPQLRGAILTGLVVTLAGAATVWRQIGDRVLRLTAIGAIALVSALAVYLPGTPTFRILPAHVILSADDPLIAAPLRVATSESDVISDGVQRAMGLPEVARFTSHSCTEGRDDDQTGTKLRCSYVQRRVFRVDGQFPEAITVIGERLHQAGFDQFSDVATIMVADYVHQKVNGPRTARTGKFVVSDIGSEMLEPPDVNASLVDFAFAETETIVDPINPWEQLTQPSRDVLETAKAVAIVEVTTLFSRAL